MTPEGVKRTEHVAGRESVTDKTGRKLDFAILGGLVLVGVLIVGSRFMSQKMAAPEIAVQTETLKTTEVNEAVEVDKDERPSIAVLAFADLSEGGDQEYFSDGMAEEILNALARYQTCGLPDAPRHFPSRARMKI